MKPALTDRAPSRIVIVQGHPDPRGHHFGHVLGDAYASGAREGGHTVERIDVATLVLAMPADDSSQEPVDALEVKNLSIRFGKTDILRNVSFHAPAGTSLAVTGPNGSGKTVLFRALIRVEIMPPAINPLSPKNLVLADRTARAVLEKARALRRQERLLFESLRQRTNGCSGQSGVSGHRRRLLPPHYAAQNLSQPPRPSRL